MSCNVHSIVFYETSPHKLYQIRRQHVPFPRKTHNDNIAWEMPDNSLDKKHPHAGRAYSTRLTNAVS